MEKNVQETIARQPGRVPFLAPFTLLNVECRTRNRRISKCGTSSFDIPCSTFDIHLVARQGAF